MSIFVNYYPCSYGDSLINMFLGKNQSRQNNLIRVAKSPFKFLDFYNLEQGEQQKILDNLTDWIYGCHRQNQFDFGPAHTVISIVLDVADFLPERVKQVHITQLGKDISRPILKQMKSKITLEEIIKLDYQLWSKENILSTDVILPISMLHDHTKLKNFCDQHSFEFDQTKVDEILNDMKQYVLQ